ncbi:ESCRT-0 subunit protein hse1 [Mortierella polycephala]|uniref:ESCRT-0 subunit protein hse1 n=1 Tax=Mortierella polycephala TaxID=41804 RepID=A0A9P6U9A4_9FUNG|nr:ESCRT-0 subunit protein hse1 [Mortierella polycephala]
MLKCSKCSECSPFLTRLLERSWRTICRWRKNSSHGAYHALLNKKTRVWIERTRRSSPQSAWSNSIDLLTADSTLLSEHKPVPSVQSKVHDLARRYSAMAKQSTATDSDLGLPHNNRSRGGSFGRTEVSKVADLLGRYNETTAAVTTGTRSRASSGVGSTTDQEMSQENTSESKDESETVAMEEEKKGVPVNENADVDIEKEIETSLRMADLTEKVEDIDLVDIPLNNHTSGNDAESNRDSYSCEEAEEAVQETNRFDLEEDSSLALGSQSLFHPLDAHNDNNAILMSSSMAQAACTHILQSLQGHISFLNGQGIITDESLKIILAELDLKTIISPSNAAQGRASLDGELQMLDLPTRTVSMTTDSAKPESSSSNHQTQSFHFHNERHQGLEQSDAVSDSDYEQECESDLEQQKRLLRQEQQLERRSVDMTTGELDSLVAASMTDDQDQEEGEVIVLQGADDDDDDDEDVTELHYDRSLPVSSSSPLNNSRKPELPPLSFANHSSPSASRLSSFDTTSAVTPASNAAPTTGLVGPETAAMSHPQPVVEFTSVYLPTSSVLSSVPVDSSSAVYSARPKQDEEENSGSATSPVTTTATTAAAIAAASAIRSLPSTNLEHSEQRNTNLAYTPTPEHIQYPPVPAAALASVDARIDTSNPVYSPVYGHTHQESATAGSVSHQSDAAAAHASLTSAPSPVVYQPQVFTPPQPDQQPQPQQQQQKAQLYQPNSSPVTDDGSMSIAEILSEMGQDQPKEHGVERLPSRHIHETSASTALSTYDSELKSLMESGKGSEHQPPTPPPKDDFNAPVTSHPPVSTQTTMQTNTATSMTPAATPFATPDSAMHQPLPMPVQPYQLYQPKPYQPKSKPSTRKPLKAQTSLDAIDQPTAAQPQPQAETQSQALSQSQGQSQIPVQFPTQVQPQAEPAASHSFQQQQQQQQQFQQQYHLQQQYQAQQQQQQQQHQQQYFQHQQTPAPHPAVHTGPEVAPTSAGIISATSAASSTSESSSKPGKGWMNAIRSSLLPKESKKESKDAKANHAHQHDNPVKGQAIPAPITTMSPTTQYGPPQSQFGPPQSQYGPPQSHFGPASTQFTPGQAPMSMAPNVIQTTSPMSSQGSMSFSNGGPMFSTAGLNHGPIPTHGHQESSRNEPATSFATPQFQQQQPGQEQQSPVSAGSAPVTPIGDVDRRDARVSSGAQDPSANRMSNLPSSSFKGAPLKTDNMEAVSAASAAIKAGRISTSTAPLQNVYGRNDTAVNSPYQPSSQQELQPVVKTQDQGQQPPVSPVSDTSSRHSTMSTMSEVRNLQVIARAQAMFDFAGEDDGDLPFKVGDIINVIEYLNADWWRGILRKDVGIFPTAYVQELKPPVNGKYPTISVSVRQSIIGAPSANSFQQQELGSGPAVSPIQQQPSFRANYQPSLGGAATSMANVDAASTSAAPHPSIGTSNAPFQPIGVASTTAMGVEGTPTPGVPSAEGQAGSASFPTPPPPPSGSQSATSVYTYFPGSGNQPPISPPPSMRNSSQRLDNIQGQGPAPGQQAYSQGGQQALYQQYQQQQQQQPQGGYYGNQQQQQQQSAPTSPTGAAGSSSYMTTKQMAAAVKSKKKFGSKW